MNFLKNFIKNHETIRDHFFHGEDEDKVIEFLSKKGLFCPNNIQTEEQMKSPCYEEIVKSIDFYFFYFL
jgi:hypothetical protein